MQSSAVRRQATRAIVASLCFACVTPFFGISRAHAVPGPDSVAVLANVNVPESVMLADRYAAARGIPERQVCKLDLPVTIDITEMDYESRVRAPLEACLTRGRALERIEAVVIMRGVPLRVYIAAAPESPIALAAALATWKSTVDDRPMVGLDTNSIAFPSPLMSMRVFEAGTVVERGNITWRPLLVTMLHGYTAADAWSLVESGLTAERMGGARGEFLFMEGADSARNVRDVEFDDVMAVIRRAGFTNVARVPYSPDLTGHTLASFVVGTPGLGQTIEGNHYQPGAIVDNVTSFGAHPNNFDPSAEEVQASIARWVHLGVAGAHGAVNEPRNNVFPSRYFIADYVRGSTLAEAYYRRLPYAYWMNLVLGDPMTAPYAVRPVVTIAGVTEGASVTGGRQLQVHATDAMGRAIGSLSLYADGELVAHADGDSIDACVDLPPGRNVPLLAVAQIAYDESNDAATYYQPKGWSVTHIDVTSGTRCDAMTVDAGDAADASVPGTGDAGPRVDTQPPSKCSCGAAVGAARGASLPTRGGFIGLFIALAAAVRRRRARPLGAHR